MNAKFNWLSRIQTYLQDMILPTELMTFSDGQKQVILMYRFSVLTLTFLVLKENNHLNSDLLVHVWQRFSQNGDAKFGWPNTCMVANELGWAATGSRLFLYSLGINYDNHFIFKHQGPYLFPFLVYHLV